MRIANLLLSAAGMLVLFSSCHKDAVEAKVVVKDTIETAPPQLKGFTINIGANAAGYFAGIPVHYSETNKRYPLLIYIHGLGHFGNGEAELPLLLSDGIPALLDTKKFPANINVKGQNFSFIVIAPQFRTYVSNNDIQAVIDFARTTYRIDSSRIYVSGFSLGGRATADFGAYNTSTVAAIVPMAGASNWEVDIKAQLIARGKLPVWAFHNEEDQLISVDETKSFIAAINHYNPTMIPKLTIFPSSQAVLKHDAWTTACDPAYRENGMNIYEWMLQFKK